MPTSYLDFENLSNGLFQEWNNSERNANTDDTKATHSTHRNRIELEQIFLRVGLQTNVASRIADEVYNKLGLSADQCISFTDFLSLIQSDVVKATNKSADEYTISPLNDHMIFDMHAPSGLLLLHSLSLSLFLSTL